MANGLRALRGEKRGALSRHDASSRYGESPPWSYQPLISRSVIALITHSIQEKDLVRLSAA